MSLSIVNSVYGLYRTEILRADGTVRWDSGLRPNLITDWGLNQLGYSTGDFVHSCFVGTGTTAPVPTDNKLQAQVMSANNSSQKTSTFGKQIATAPYYSWVQSVWTFGAATANVTLGEMGTGSSGTSLVTRSLMKDADGNPTTITLLIGEVLRVTHVLRNYFDMGDNAGSFEIDGVTYNYSARGINFRSTDEWQIRGGWAYPDIVSCCTIPADAVWESVGTLDQKTSKSWTDRKIISPSQTPRPPNPSPGVTRWVVQFGVNDANYPLGIRYFEMQHTQNNYRDGVSYGILLDKAIPKTNKHQLTLTLDMIYKRHTP